MKQNEDFVALILQHEGLLPGQTPFRVTNPSMRNWNTIHGYKINRNANAPANRRNFLYLQNPGDVAPAVRQQFRNYAQAPARYGLPQNPTVMQAISVFDQTGAKAKAAFLKSRGVKLDEPLVDFF